MVIEVIARQVREDRGIEATTRHPVLAQRVRGDLHRDPPAAGSSHVDQGAVEFHGRRRRHRRRALLARPALADRTENTHAHAGRAEHVVEKIGATGLAIGSRNADQVHALGRVAERERRNNTGRADDVVNENARDTVGRDVARAHGSHGAGRERVGDVLRPVGPRAGQRQEHVSRTNRARVLRNSGDPGLQGTVGLALETGFAQPAEERTDRGAGAAFTHVDRLPHRTPSSAALSTKPRAAPPGHGPG